MRIKEILILFLLIVPAALSLFKPGFFGASDDMHIAWLQQMNQAITEGQIPPRYVSDLSFGFGYPLFNFIFPLPYYLGEIFHLTGLSFVYSVKAVFIFSLFVSALTMYFLARYLSGKFVGMAAAILYVYSPYRSTDIYGRGALGESLAFAFLPLIIFSLIKLAEAINKKESFKWVGIGGLSIIALILTHNIVSYMFIPFALLLTLLIVKKEKFFYFFIMFFLGLIGSIYFWFPALSESGLMQYNTVFNFFDHFPTLKQLITPFWGYGASVPGPYDGMSFFIGEVNLIVLVITTLYLVFCFSKITVMIKKTSIWCFLLVVISVFMMNFRSTWFWENVPLISYFQFPWRFLTMIVLASSLLVVLFKNFKHSNIIAVIIIIISMGLNISRFKPHDFLNRDDNYYINRYIPVPTPSDEYLTLQEEYLRLPKTTEVRPTQVYDRVYPVSKQITNLTLINSLESKFTTDSESELILNYNKYYFPGWKGFIDGKELNLFAGKPYGQIQFLVPKGKHEITIKYKETTLNVIFDLITISTIIFCFYLIFKKNQK